MTSKKKNNYKARMQKEKIQVQQEKKRLKELPKALRKLETKLSQHIELMEVYDGYIGDFTGEIVPIEPVKNPLTILNEMELNLQHRNALNNESIQQHIIALEKAFSKMGFYLNLMELTENANAAIYDLLYFYINNPPKEDVYIQTTLSYKNFSLTIERYDKHDLLVHIPDTPDTMKNIQKYVDQLIEDLEQVAKNPPAPIPYETPPHLEQIPIAAEISLTPNKTIEELTDIKQEMFPQLIDLYPDQCKQVNDAIFKVFDALNIELIDAPENIPPEWLYDVLTTNWHQYVQYLPEAGMDLELCTGDPETCPYGNYCDCGEDWDIYELPERFDLPLIEQIVQLLLKENIVYLHPDTLETEYTCKTLKNATKSSSKHNSWNECITFFPLKNEEWINLMENFMFQFEDESFQEEFTCVLQSKNIFKDFNLLITNSQYADRWFDFKLFCLKDKVRSTIHDELLKKTEPLSDDELPF